ncbi:MAG: hypothetical protein LBK07_11455 [Tannerella sp.]|nr:hypothetical protein [Tannerella sp.]
MPAAKSDTPETNHNMLAFAKLATRSPAWLVFDSSQHGRTAYIATRWQNRREGGELML